jgi:hypothetical protein
MKTFEIWVQQSNGHNKSSAQHILEAEKVSYRDGHYFFLNEGGTVLHAIAATPGMLIRTVQPK